MKPNESDNEKQNEMTPAEAVEESEVTIAYFILMAVALIALFWATKTFQTFRGIVVPIILMACFILLLLTAANIVAWALYTVIRHAIEKKQKASVKAKGVIATEIFCRSGNDFLPYF